MPITLKDSLAHLNVPDLKDLLSHLPGVEKLGRKDELIERLVAALLGSGLKAIWSGLDETQQAAVAEAVHDPLGEYSEQRFRARYQRVPSFRVAGAKSYGYSGGKRSALGLFIHYAHEDRRSFVSVELRELLKAFVPPPTPLELESKETLADDDGRVLRLAEREALQEVVVMLRTIEQARILVSEKTALPSTTALRVLSEKLAGGDFYPWVEKKNKWDQEIGPIKACAWPLLLQAGSWRLDREKALSAIEKGYAITELQGFLESRDDMPLPPTVESFIVQCARNGKALRIVGNAVLIECRDSETAVAIAAHKETGALCLRAGAKALVVRLDHVDKFRERVRLLGFGLVS